MRVLFLASIFLGISLLPGPAAAQDGEVIAFGDAFPEIALPAPPDPASRGYLGIPEGETFLPSQVQTEVLLVELLNVHCPHCQMQTASFNELFSLIETGSATRGRIKMLGIAVGNLAGEVETFTRRFQVPFPVVPDPRFQAYRAIGGSVTPYTIYVRQEGSGKPGVVAGTHLGLNTHYQELYAELQRLAATDPAEFHRQGRAASKVRQAIAPLFTEEQIAYRVRTALIAAGGTLADFARLDLRSGRRVYTGLMRRGGRLERLFAEVTSRLSVCDICHDVHFIYVFDTAGQVVGFEPLQLTKYGNVNWNARDVETMRGRLLGRFLTVPHSYDPQVDAVTTATITSAIIFDSLEQGQALMQELRGLGLLGR